MRPTKEIIENLATETLLSSLALRFDICTCRICRDAMFKRMLERLPEESDLAEQTDLRDIKDIKARYDVPLSLACMQAIDEIESKPPHIVKEDTTKGFDQLVKKILTARNLDLRYYHTQQLKNKFALRINALKLRSYMDYIRLLEKNPQEYTDLFSALGIDSSEFFRDAPVWITLRYLLENVTRRKQRAAQRRIRIWSAGCGTGEEPFSLAILAREVISHIAPEMRVQIYGTDINAPCLAACEKGEYPQSHMVNVDKALIDQYFIRKNEVLTAGEELRQLTTFQRLDLASDETIADTDLIVCRNVFIYFNKLLRVRLLSKFHQSLLAPGFLVLGKGEPLPPETSAEFEEIDPSARISRKK